VMDDVRCSRLYSENSRASAAYSAACDTFMRPAASSTDLTML